MRKKAKHIHASATGLLHIRIGSLHEAREIDCLCYREVNAMRIASYCFG